MGAERKSGGGSDEGGGEGERWWEWRGRAVVGVERKMERVAGRKSGGGSGDGGGRESGGGSGEEERWVRD